MKLQEARLLIRNTFENPFDKGRFTLFVKNLLKDTYEEKPFLQTGGQLPKAFAELIRKMERIGKYEDDEGNIIDILVVELKKGRSIEWARTTQRNFIRRYLNGSRGGELKDAALVAFYSEGSDDWRFSLIKMQYSLEKKADELTPAKRFSFLVGEDERSHTAQNQLANLLTLSSAPTLAEIESSFNIETVTKEFFEKYRELFLNLNEHIEKEIKKSKALREELESQNIDSASFTKKLLGQIVFLYFLQKKGWLGVPKSENWNKGDKQFLRTLLSQALEEKENFFSDYLVYLFYEALATEHRGGSDPSYYPRLNCRIPFLNGGLFEADYNWKKIEINIPNRLFTNTDKSEEGDIGTGVLDVFDRYNFTVKEDEPLEKEVAVDPEMLGKVFENLLEIKDRKSKGAFYTPREIVHYMCQESLIAYLDTSINGEAASYQKLGTDQTDLFGNKARKGQLALEAEHGTKLKIDRKDIEKFIREGVSAIEHDELKEAGKLISKDYILPESIRNNAEKLDQFLADIRICDPAIGSGAFPVGIMNEIVKARETLSVYLKIGKPKERTVYELKRHAIQECIYGVDIDHSAIDIAKLRLWLSLVVDEEDLTDVKPLPNLDYKIVYGNSLIGLPDDIVKNDAAEKEMEKLKEKFFGEYNLEKKKELRKKINQTIQKLLTTSNEFLSYKVEFDFKLYFSEVFHHKKGFDVVLGNPPYLRVQGLDKSQKGYFSDYFKSATGAYDLYVLFSEKGFKLLNKNGILNFIQPDKWINASMGKGLRVLVSSHLHKLISFKEHQVFNASTYSSLIWISKSKKHKFDYCELDRNLPDNELLENWLNKLNENSFVNYLNQNLSEDLWVLTSKTADIVLRKINQQQRRVKNVFERVFTGLQTSLDEVYFLSNCSANGNFVTGFSAALNRKVKIESGFLKPLLKGEQVHRYCRLETSNAVIFPYHIYREEKEYAEAMKPSFIKENFPFGWEYLQECKAEIKARENGKIANDKDWYRYLYPKNLTLFDKPKLFCPDICLKSQFAFDEKGGFYATTTLYGYLKFESISEPFTFWLGVLNSSLMWYYIQNVAVVLANGYYRYMPIFVNNFPLPIASEKQQQKIESIVDKILEGKKENPQANTSKLEKQIDIMVYHLYNLSYEEATIIDPELSEEEFDKYN